MAGKVIFLLLKVLKINSRSIRVSQNSCIFSCTLEVIVVHMAFFVEQNECPGKIYLIRKWLMTVFSILNYLDVQAVS